MSQVSAKTWNVIGRSAATLVAVSVFLALIDPVLGVATMYVAIILGGLSGIGVNSTIKFGVTTIIASLLFGLVGTHYTTSTGLRPPQSPLIWTAISIFALPILVSAMLLLLGMLRRRHKNSLDLNA